MAYLYTVTTLIIILIGMIQVNIILGMKIREKSRNRKEQKKSHKEKITKITKSEIDEYINDRKARKRNDT
jgi:hypothetical protein